MSVNFQRALAFVLGVLPIVVFICLCYVVFVNVTLEEHRDVSVIQVFDKGSKYSLWTDTGRFLVKKSKVEEEGVYKDKKYYIESYGVNYSALGLKRIVIEIKEEM